MSRLLKRVAAGEEIIIAKGGRPVARLVPFTGQERTREQETRNELLLSAASSWEIAIKCAIGKLDLPGDPEEVVPEWMLRSAVMPLVVLRGHTLRVASLPFHHADPFDRLLIAQAQMEDVPILTSDPVFRRYDVEVIAAR